jgi:hypothetical protein
LLNVFDLVVIPLESARIVNVGDSPEKVNAIELYFVATEKKKKTTEVVVSICASTPAEKQRLVGAWCCFDCYF